MKPIATILFFLLFAVLANGQDQYDAFVAEIAKLKDVAEIKNYWTSIRTADQRYRGINAIDSNDCDNTVKVVALIEHFGYPDPKIFGDVIANVPMLVMAHQNLIDVHPVVMPLFYKAYKDSLIALDMMLYTLNGYHHKKFGQFYDRYSGPHKYDPKDVGRLCVRLGVDTTFSQKPNVIEIFRKEKADQKENRSVVVVGRWRINKDSRYICYLKKDHYFLKQLDQDHGFSAPEVTLRKAQEETIIEYVQSFYGDYFKINKAGNLEYYEKDALRNEFKKI